MQSPKLVIDDFKNVIIRRTIYEFYLQDKIHKLLPKLRDSINVKGSSSTSRKLVEGIWFP